MKKIQFFIFALFLSSGVLSQDYFSMLDNKFFSLHHYHNREALPADTVQQRDKNELGSAFFLELIGRGYMSLNFEYQLIPKNRLSFGLGWNDMEVNATKGGDAYPFLLLHGLYTYIAGKGPSYFEIGLGATYAFFDIRNFEFHNEFAKGESPFSLNGVVGYRRQIKEGFLFRAGFTPLLQIPGFDFWPLIGLSFGYSW